MLTVIRDLLKSNAFKPQDFQSNKRSSRRQRTREYGKTDVISFLSKCKSDYTVLLLLNTKPTIIMYKIFHRIPFIVFPHSTFSLPNFFTHTRTHTHTHTHTHLKFKKQCSGLSSLNAEYFLLNTSTALFLFPSLSMHYDSFRRLSFMFFFSL